MNVIIPVISLSSSSFLNRASWLDGWMAGWLVDMLPLPRAWMAKVDFLAFQGGFLCVFKENMKGVRPTMCE